MTRHHRSFQTVIKRTGRKPSGARQNALRHYSETFSKETARWLQELCVSRKIGSRVMAPEESIGTVYGKKRLDVGAVDDRGYLVLDFSIKTFNFRRRKNAKRQKGGNYRHNYTGRFYELLGEELDLRRSYRFATLVALIFLPSDSVEDGAPSSFALAVKQFSKIARLPNEAPQSASFDHVFVAIHDNKGHLYLFDAAHEAPIGGMPLRRELLTIDQVLDTVTATVRIRGSQLRRDSCPRVREYRFGPDRRAD